MAWRNVASAGSNNRLCVTVKCVVAMRSKKSENGVDGVKQQQHEISWRNALWRGAGARLASKISGTMSGMAASLRCGNSA